MSKLFATLLIMLEILHNYFYSLIKLFSDLYLTKFLNTLTKIILSMCVFEKNIVLNLP